MGKKLKPVIQSNKVIKRLSSNVSNEKEEIQNNSYENRLIQPFHSQFLLATKNTLVKLSKKCHWIEKDRKILKEWQRQYKKRIGKKKEISSYEGKEKKSTNQVDPKDKHIINKIQINRQKAQYQNQYLNKWYRQRQEEQQRNLNNFRQKMRRLEEFKKWQYQFMDDQYMEISFDPEIDSHKTSVKYNYSIDTQKRGQYQSLIKPQINPNQKGDFKDIKVQDTSYIHLYSLRLQQLLIIFINELISPQYTCLCPQPSILPSLSPIPGLTTNIINRSKCHCSNPTAVHRAVATDLDICRQIQEVMTILQYSNPPQLNSDIRINKKSTQFLYGCRFNEDRTILLNNKGTLQSDIFGQQIITPFQHRGLAMLLKRINHKKYSVQVPKNKKINQKNNLISKFYEDQYQKTNEQYYKQLLQLQLQFKRYTQTSSQSGRIVIGKNRKKFGPTNFVRKLLTAVFQDRIRGSDFTMKEIYHLESDIDASAMAEILLYKMRPICQQELRSLDEAEGIKTQLQIFPKILFKCSLEKDQTKCKKVQKKNHNIVKQDEKQKPNINQRYKFNPDLVGTLIDEKQKRAIQKTLQRFEKNKIQVPYPKCMFLQQRLAAFRQQSYKNSNIQSCSSDSQNSKISFGKEIQEDNNKYRRLKELHVYKGYRGYKTSLKVAQNRKMNKGIIRNARLHSNQEQFYLSQLQDMNKISLKQNKNCLQQVNDDLKLIPFPFYLSIFSKDGESRNQRENTPEENRNTVIREQSNNTEQNVGSEKVKNKKVREIIDLTY